MLPFRVVLAWHAQAFPEASKLLAESQEVQMDEELQAKHPKEQAIQASPLATCPVRHWH